MRSIIKKILKEEINDFDWVSEIKPMKPEMEFLKDNSRLTFDIQKLVDDGIIFVTEPGDGQGGVANPNWEGDCSVITLLNLTDEELELNPWRKEAIDRPFSECIPYVQDRQGDWSEEKYQQVIDSIKMKGGEIDSYIL